MYETPRKTLESRLDSRRPRRVLTIVLLGAVLSLGFGSLAHSTETAPTPAKKARGTVKIQRVSHTPPVSAPPEATPANAPTKTAPAVADSTAPVDVALDAAKKFHADGTALFLDARSAEEYAEGHIAGAVNLPFDDVFKHPALAKAVDAKGRVLITYCSGGDCDLSRNLAFSLIEAGYHKVLVFTGGIPEWTSANLPVHKGVVP